jgi:hypothetical protein
MPSSPEPNTLFGFRLNTALFVGLIRPTGVGKSTRSGRWTCGRWGSACTGIGRNTYYCFRSDPHSSAWKTSPTFVDALTGGHHGLWKGPTFHLPVRTRKESSPFNSILRLTDALCNAAARPLMTKVEIRVKGRSSIALMARLSCFTLRSCITRIQGQ